MAVVLVPQVAALIVLGAAGPGGGMGTSGMGDGVLVASTAATAVVEAAYILVMPR